MIDPAQAFMNQQQQQQAAGFAFGGQQYPGAFGQQQQSQHSKSYSLPVAFDPLQQQHQAQILPPPERAFNLNGDVPLPSGWSSEKAPNGQTYYYNQMTKQSSWEDPRKLYNLPMYQNEINYDLRAHIYKSIPLPNGWQEARTETGKVYYINHNTRMTHWEDPRIEIYMQQEQQKYAMAGHHQNQFGMAPQTPISQTLPVQQANAGFAKSSPFQDFGQQQPVLAPTTAAYQQPSGFNNMATGGAGYHPYNHSNPGSAVKNQHLAAAVAASSCPSSSMRMLKSPAATATATSMHSSSLTSLSNSSSSSSLSSALSSSQELLSSSVSSSSSSSSKPLANFSNMQLPNNNNNQYIQSLRRSLDKVLESKQSICQQLNELVEQENSLKAKMRPQDVDDVMKLIKDGHLGGAKANEVVVLHAAQTAAHASLPAASSNNNNNNTSFPGGLETQLITGLNTTDPSIEMDQLDSTLVVADTSANNSNVINDN